MHAEAGRHCPVQSITPSWAGSGLMQLHHLVLPPSLPPSLPPLQRNPPRHGMRIILFLPRQQVKRQIHIHALSSCLPAPLPPPFLPPPSSRTLTSPPTPSWLMRLAAKSRKRREGRRPCAREAASSHAPSSPAWLRKRSRYCSFSRGEGGKEEGEDEDEVEEGREAEVR